MRLGLIVLLAVGVAGMALAGRPRPWVWALPAGVAPPAVPAANPMSAARVALGRRLFYEADLSIDGTMSCATCHGQRDSFSDNAVTHPGVHGDPGLRNVPSLLNVAWNSPLTWADSRLTALEDQVTVPVLGTDPVEMGMNGKEAEIIRRLSANACYRKLFKAAFPKEKGRIDLATAARALAAFQRTIVSFDTGWDRAQADGPPLPDEARRGETLFRGAAGCASCHGGVNFSDSGFHPFAPGMRDPGFTHDPGLARATGRVADRGLFRTPGLRNVALTPPYLHDGSARTIEDAIARHGIVLTPGDVAAIKAFLGELTDRSVTTDARFTRPPSRCSTEA